MKKEAESEGTCLASFLLLTSLLILSALHSSTALKLSLDTLGNYYLANISLGNPQQYFSISFSTTSADFWVPSIRCLDIGCVQKNKYNRAASSTYAPDGRPIVIDLGDGTMKGVLDRDHVLIQSTNLPITFAEADSLADSFRTRPMDGIVGLAYRSLATANTIPLFDVMVNERLVPLPVFSIYYDRKGKNSVIEFGAIDQSLFTGGLLYYPIIGNGFWEIPLDGVIVEGSDIGNCQGWFETCSARFDSGSPNIVIPSSSYEILSNLMGPIPTDCIGINNLPTLTFQFGNQAILLEPSWYILNVSNTCSLGITSNQYLSAWILGAPFLRKYYTVYDKFQDKVGIAEALHS